MTWMIHGECMSWKAMYLSNRIRKLTTTTTTRLDPNVAPVPLVPLTQGNDTCLVFVVCLVPTNAVWCVGWNECRARTILLLGWIPYTRGIPFIVGSSTPPVVYNNLVGPLWMW